MATENARSIPEPTKPDPHETNPGGIAASRPTSIRARLATGESPIHNFTGDSKAQWKLSALACGPIPKEGGDMAGEVIDLQYYYCHNIPMVSQATGDEIDAPRCVLIGKNGDAWRWVATSVIDALDNLISVFGYGPYTEPIEFTVVKGKSRKGNTIYTFQPAD